MRETFGDFVYLMKHLTSLVFGDIYCLCLDAVAPHKNTTRSSAHSSLRVVALYCQQGAASQTDWWQDGERVFLEIYFLMLLFRDLIRLTVKIHIKQTET